MIEHNHVVARVVLPSGRSTLRPLFAVECLDALARLLAAEEIVAVELVSCEHASYCTWKWTSPSVRTVSLAHEDFGATVDAYTRKGWTLAHSEASAVVLSRRGQFRRIEVV